MASAQWRISRRFSKKNLECSEINLRWDFKLMGDLRLVERLSESATWLTSIWNLDLVWIYLLVWYFYCTTLEDRGKISLLIHFLSFSMRNRLYNRNRFKLRDMLLTYLLMTHWYNKLCIHNLSTSYDVTTPTGGSIGSDIKLKYEFFKAVHA